MKRPRGVVRRPPRKFGPALSVRGADLHHLRLLDVDFPSSSITAVTGVSGSGKTSLIFGVLAASAKGAPMGCRGVYGLDRFAAIVDVAPSLRGGSSISSVATASGVFDTVRSLYATTDAAKQLGLKVGAFSLGSRGGRCETCKGLGRTRSDMDFLGEAWAVCDDCGGRRFGSEVLSVSRRGLDLGALLERSVAEVRELFADVPKIERPLGALVRLGLGYLRFGQGADTLSGGEAQRLFLATELMRGAEAPTLYLLDEPTRGLHPDDVDSLLTLLGELADEGHTVIVVEHDVEVIASSDHVVDLGPGAGAEGGAVVYAGPPANLPSCEESLTGRFLRVEIARGR